MKRRLAGLSLLEALVSLGLMFLVISVALSVLNLALREQLVVTGRVAAERNLLQASVMLRSEARCAAFIYCEDTTEARDIVMTNNFFTRKIPPVMVRYHWTPQGSLNRTKCLVSGISTPVLVATGLKDLSCTPLAELPANRGLRVRIRTDYGLAGDVLLVSDCITSEPVQAGYYSTVFWASFWQGWTRGIQAEISEGGKLF